MTSFAHVDFLTVHPGVERAERTVELLTPVMATLAAIAEPLLHAYSAWANARQQARKSPSYWDV